MIATTSILPGAKGVDYSFGRPDPAEMARLGYRFAVRYISTRIDHPKNITADEIKRLHDAGIAVLFVWETTVTRPFDGYAAGAADGKASRAWCERLGYPTSVPVLAAVDTDVTTKTLQAVLAYLDGFAEGLGPWPLGIYADTDVIEAMAGRSVLNWKPNARAWSTKPSALVHVQQHASTTVAGGLVDTNTALRPFTAWLPNDAPPEPIAPQEDDMRPRLIQTPGDAAVFVTDGIYAVWGISGDTIAAMQSVGVWDTAPAQTVPKSALKALTLLGPEPDYTGVDPALAGRTTRGDFAATPVAAVAFPSFTVTGKAVPA